ncbi:LysR family transcriptional regulator [Streptomyces sp. NPDC050211]|uniref:LysR family transcriptional regulator n=1 Tax=Streptomyces sp. NPDC050211 TaxID=3154932 RepID=UPI003445BBD2
MDVGLQQLRCFLTLAEEQHFTWAAERLGIPQPTLSRTIRRLEEHVGRQLLDRTTRHPRLTPDGERLRSELQTLLPRLEAVLRPGPAEEPLSLGYTWGFPLKRGREAIDLLERRHQVIVQPVRRDERLAGVHTGAVDAALLWGQVDDPRLHTVEIARERRVAVISTRSTLAARPRVTWRDLGRRCLVLNTVTGTLTPDDWSADTRPEIGAEATNIDEYLHAVAARRGVGVLPASVAAQHPDPDVRYLPLTGAPEAVLHYAYPRTNPHPHTQNLANALCRSAPKGRGELRDQPQRTRTHRRSEAPTV